MTRLALWYLNLPNTVPGAILFFALMPVIGLLFWTLLSMVGVVFGR